MAALAEEEEASSLDPNWTSRPINDLKIPSIYNRSATEPPAEVQLVVDFIYSSSIALINLVA